MSKGLLYSVILHIVFFGGALITSPFDLRKKMDLGDVIKVTIKSMPELKAAEPVSISPPTTPQAIMVDEPPDIPLSDPLTVKEKKKAIVLITSKEVLRKRVKNREIIESGVGKFEDNSYPQDRWLDIYQKIDLEKLYASWINELEKRDIEYQLINSTTASFAEIKGRSAVPFLGK